MKVMLVVTHLLGTGHLARALVLGRAFGDAGHRVLLVSGGMPAPHLCSSGVDLVQLPPLRSDGVNFTRLLDETGAPVAGGSLEARKTQLLTALRDFQPDVLITELFPFGRRVLAPEFTALLAAAQTGATPPLICASVRDILAPPSKPAKAQATAALIGQFYDAVLVHSDPDVTPLEASWPVTGDMAAKLRYTGFVAPPPALKPSVAQGAGEVIVSAGGGNVGAAVYDTAVQAAARAPDLTWRLLVAGSDAPARIADLRSKAPGNVIVDPATPDFRQMLHVAAASISLCGYNTALDILQAGTPAIFVPFDAGGEVEQTIRARTLSGLRGIETVTAASLSTDSLLRSLHRVIAAPRRAPRKQGLDGAARTVAIVSGLWQETVR